MCLAICDYSTTNLIPIKAFHNAARTNSDGMGLLYAKDGKLNTFKSMNKDVEEFYKQYEFAKAETAGTGSPVVIHFRMATHGIKNEDNCHPFIVNETIGFIHNGVFSNMPKCEQRSDTSVLNDSILKELDYGFIYNMGTIRLLSHLCNTGNGSKLVFLDHNGIARIINENAGHWNGETWYSNKSYTYDITRTVTNAYSGSYIGSNRTTNVDSGVKTGFRSEPESNIMPPLMKAQ